MRGKHRDMWQFIIDKVDDFSTDPGADIKFNCYACEKFFNNGCSECIIGKKVGCCTYDYSAFQSLLAAIRNRDRKEFIRQAEVIRDVWN